ITVIDTEENQKTVASYISQLPTGKPKLLSKIFKINHVDPSRLQATIRQLLQESRGIGLGGLGGMGAWIEQTITPGSEGALTWQDLYVELTQLSGDTANPVARIYILVTSTGRDRERDFRRGESERVDNYRVRVKDIRLEAQEVDIEIRVVGLPGVTPGALAPGVAMPGVPSVTVPAAPAPAIPPTPQVGRVTMRVDSQTNSLIVMAEDPADLDMISEWIEKLDQPILQVSIEARFVEVNETKAKKLGIDWLIPSIHDTGSWRAVTDELRFAQPQDHPAVDLDPLYQTLRSHNLLRGMTVLQYVSEGGVSATLQALEAQGVVNVIQAPRVLALNQQPATITFSQAVPWMTWSLSAQALTVSWSEDSIGISLQVTPTIHSKESIILDIEPRVDKLVNRIPAGYDLVSNLAAPGISRNIWDYEIAGRPVIDRRSLTTRARIRSGETLVLGGLIEEREHITIERLLYQTRPGLWAPAYLVCPKNKPGRLPAILCPPGHGEGMNQVLFEKGDYKRYPIELAERGFVTLVPENIGFGERVGRTDDATHQFYYLAVNLLGESMMGFLIWDLQRALDVLEGLPNVDRSRIGCYGLSLGGELTLLTTAVDERIKCACISGFFTSYASTFLNVCHCGCGYVHGLAAEFEHVDIASLIVPKPLLLETGAKDTGFPTHVARTSFAALLDEYALYDAADRLELDAFDGKHEISGKRAYEWFKKWLG
ncbi:MAG: secretin N-terminal domain-containing protein, partial [Nitrososphaerota archaeon]